MAELASTICWNTNSLIAKSIPQSLRLQLDRRSFSDIPLQLQHSHPLREFLRLFSSQFNIPVLHAHERGALSIDMVYRRFDKYISLRLDRLHNLTGVYAYEDCALATFEAAKKRKLCCFYDLPIGYWRAAQLLFSEESELQPLWASTLTGLKDSDHKLSRKDQELALADVVIVPSNFVRNTLETFNASSALIKVIPFGSPLVPTLSKTCSHDGPLRVLYVGSLGQRKGLSYALDAIDILGSQVKLTLIGKRPVLDCVPLNLALDKHHWIESLPHDQILEQMACHDILLLPSLFEGYALVISEALSRGLPVITTPNSGATETVRDGIEGFIVPIRDVDAIADRLQILIDDRARLALMSHYCLQRAADLSWSMYEDSISTIVQENLCLSALSE
ncbi:glycosyltransferase family 4 protein [Synechococcus sp. CS-1331]|uniref:glycosyltransferase family 4 protein n=1 Tax=Synechococcus sp. CS-1331 TaxID=2847973 RepID=UPI00223AE8C0|nr:glycosyltransferase family 4 protein [Synechococcus sp. CS-1331]MCT0227558.1 glycosyltransferase family 4 protein [Synechococcus sp. CS-1331]